MGFNYNSKLRCPELLLQEDKNIILIRKRETFNNLVMNTKTYKDNKLMVIFGQICIIFAMFLILYFLFY
jgi:hypothetical protein